ncbi:MAG: 4Fe-4S binding protein [Clostridia bacterium]|jgi:2-oxoacid:acceptor oxidoreductase delta subunit (pyruvate/2-ketoisovalerate family)|nr:4Fe-4S binding protein [Clostridia bacterium]
MTNCKHPNKTKVLFGPVATIFSSTKTGTWRIVKPVVDQEKCSFCGNCQKYCPTDVVTIQKETENRGVSFDFDYCKGCGICANVCPKECIAMIPERGE